MLRVLIVLLLAGTVTAEASNRADPACMRNGCLRQYTFVGSYPKSALLPYAESGVEFDNGYSVYTLRYWTDGREATATATIPFDPRLRAPKGGWHIAANNHGTTGLDDPCAVSASIAGVGLAGFFGARGLIGVTVDYPGLGTDGLHAYLDKRSEGTAVLDGLRATRSLARLLRVRVSERYAIAGLSQGGHATLSAATLASDYAPELDIRAYAAAAPATVWEEHWSLGVRVPGWHIPVHAMLLYSWSKTYDWRDLPLWTDAVARTIDATMAQLCVFSSGGPTLVQALPQVPAQLFHPDLLREYSTRQWSRYGAVHDAFADNAIRNLPASGPPVRIYQGDADTVVPEAATREVVEALRAGGAAIEYVVVPGGQHTDVAFHFLALRQSRAGDAVAWLRGRLDADAD